MYEPSPILAPLLYAPALLYEAGVRARNVLYAAGWLQVRRAAAPVISIGNITLGGTGKTPLVMHVADTLRKCGATVAMLSRGYGRQGEEKTRIVAPEETVPSPALDLGDEPALVRRRIPSIWLGISADRHRAAAGILQRCKNPVFLLDDGFQHRRLHRDMDIVVLDTTQPLFQNRMFPRGSLREPLSGLRRAHVIIMNRTAGIEDSWNHLEGDLRTWAPEANVLVCRQPVETLVPYEKWRSGAASSNIGMPRSSFLAAAVGNPSRLEAGIENLGVEVSGRRIFRDHYQIGPKDWKTCAAQASRCGAEAVITTEKDAVKISGRPDFPLLIAVQKTWFEAQGELERVLKHMLELWHA
jgi:tetraacyldisaccharide 4'-kinase